MLPTATGNASAVAGTTPAAEPAFEPDAFAPEVVMAPDGALLAVAVAGPEVDVLAEVEQPARTSPVIATSAARAAVYRRCVFTTGSVSPRRPRQGPRDNETRPTRSGNYAIVHNQPDSAYGPLKYQ